MARRSRSPETLDTELLALPPDERWRTWMGRVEAVIFAAPEPVGRESLARVVGRDCNLELLLDDIRGELAGRPYELVPVAGGWQHRTKKGFADAIHTATGRGGHRPAAVADREPVLMAIAYLQPITRSALGEILGKEISRDLIGALRHSLHRRRARAARSRRPLHLVTTRPSCRSSASRAARAAGYGEPRGCRAAEQGTGCWQEHSQKRSRHER